MSRSHPSEARWPQLQPPATRVKTNKRRPGRFFAPFTSDTININTWSVLCFDRSLFPSKVCVLSQNTLEYLLLVHPSLSVPGWTATHRPGGGKRERMMTKAASCSALPGHWTMKLLLTWSDHRTTHLKMQLEHG